MRILTKAFGFFFIVFFPFQVYSEEHKLSICAIFKNEASILKEWIEFHLIQGVEHFYLYNNNSSDDYQEVLSPYLASNQVTLINWLYTYKPAAKRQDICEWHQIQVAAYNDCLAKFGLMNSWIAFIDIDEFLFCPDRILLPIYLKSFEKYAGIGVNWLNFGTSFIHELPLGELLIKNFIYCSDGNHFRDYSYKSIVQPSFVLKCLDAHSFLPKERFSVVDCHKKKIKQKIRHTSKDVESIRINHYWTRDEKFFASKILNRQQRRSFVTTETLQGYAENLNSKIDLEIQKFVPELQKRMGY